MTVFRFGLLSRIRSRYGPWCPPSAGHPGNRRRPAARKTLTPPFCGRLLSGVSMSTSLTGVLLPADLDRPPEAVTFHADDLSFYRGIVGGNIEPVHLLAPAGTMYVNEDGIDLRLPLNQRATLLTAAANPAWRVVCCSGTHWSWAQWTPMAGTPWRRWTTRRFCSPGPAAGFTSSSRPRQVGDAGSCPVWSGQRCSPPTPRVSSLLKPFQGWRYGSFPSPDRPPHQDPLSVLWFRLLLESS